MSTEDNKQFIRKVTEEVYSRGDLAAIDRYYAPDWVAHDAPPNAGGDRESLKEVLGVIRSGFPDVRASIEVILAEGDLVASRTTAEGTHTREYFGVAPTGKRVTLRQRAADVVPHLLVDGIREAILASKARGSNFSPARPATTVRNPTRFKTRLPVRLRDYSIRSTD